MRQPLAIPDMRILRGVDARPPVAVARSLQPAPSGRLSMRVPTAADLPWIESWSSALGLPAPVNARHHARVLLRDAARVGFLCGRKEGLETERGHERIMWVVSAFVVPSLRGQGYLMRFAEMASREVYPAGLLAARVAAHNQRMHKLMRAGGWRVLRSARGYTDYVIRLGGPYGARSS